MGGAYGGFCSMGAASGRFSYMSYRDPNLIKTLRIYDEAAAHLASTEITSEVLETAIIGTVGDLDSPMSPEQKGYAALERWLIGNTLEARQMWRDQVLSTSPTDFREFADRLAALNDRAGVCVVGSLSAIEESNKELTKPLVVKKVLAPPEHDQK
jgi:Zn-dependent M16 (insulinase) family peptidase